MQALGSNQGVNRGAYRLSYRQLQTSRVLYRSRLATYAIGHTDKGYTSRKKASGRPAHVHTNTRTLQTYSRLGAVF